MWHSSYLIHYNPNHDPKNGQFTYSNKNKTPISTKIGIGIGALSAVIAIGAAFCIKEKNERELNSFFEENGFDFVDKQMWFSLANDPDILFDKDEFVEDVRKRHEEINKSDNIFFAKEKEYDDYLNWKKERGY